MSGHKHDKFLQDDLLDDQVKAHRTFRISDPAIVALILIVLAIVAGLGKAC